MKKLLLLLMLVGVLNSSEFMCNASLKRWSKNNVLFKMALDRDDYSRMYSLNEMRIYYIEQSIAECKGFYDISDIKILRKSHIKVKGLIKNALQY